MLKAFIVEDNPVIRENLVATLEEMVPTLKVLGFADSERGALAWLGAPGHDCDLIVVDLFLRQGSGMQVLEQLRRAGHAAHRVVLTNYATPDVSRQCLGLGASRVFDKSGDIDALIDHCLRLAGAPAGPSTHSAHSAPSAPTVPPATAGDGAGDAPEPGPG
jgi:DNA-binding NarL/FixJ family response regulator